LAGLGQQLFDWDTPDGYPDTAEYWAGNVLPKWNAASTISRFPPIITGPYLAGSTAAAVDLLSDNFFGGEMPASTRDGLLKFAGSARLDDEKIREMIALCLSCNAFQWY
jgi:hypothetical protein